MSITRKAGAAALVATMAAALPSGALARGGGGERDGGMPSRIAIKLRAADRALDRARERAEDGEADRAASSLARVRSNLASALKSAKRRIADGNPAGAPSAGAVARADHDVVAGTAAMFDGRSGALVDAIATTLDAAISNRDDLIAAIAALSDRSRYGRVLARMDGAVAAEIEDVTEALADDELTEEARSALNAALTRLQATDTAIGAAGGSAAGYPGEGAEYGDRPPREPKCREDGPGGHRPPPPGGPGPGTGYEDQGGEYGAV